MTGFTDTAPETGRNDDSDDEIETSAEPFSPDAPWVNTFEKQLTAKLIDGLRNYARPRAYAVARAGRKVDVGGRLEPRKFGPARSGWLRAA
jgi:hypothetical protein